MHELSQNQRSIALAALLAAAALGGGCEGGSSGLPHDDASPGEIARGKRLLAQYQCGSCHEIPGVPIARGFVGPTLRSFGRRSYIAGHLPNGPEMLARWIVAPDALVPGTLMPSLGASAEDARAMAAYLLSLE